MIISTELESAIENAWKFLEVKSLIVASGDCRKKSGMVQIHKFPTGILRCGMWRRNKISCIPYNSFVSIHLFPGRKGQASWCLSEIWKAEEGIWDRPFMS